jgi:hypothetical protein
MLIADMQDQDILIIGLYSCTENDFEALGRLLIKFETRKENGFEECAFKNEPPKES